MKTYFEIERELMNLKWIKETSSINIKNRGRNFITPNVVGFIPIAENVEFEVSCGTWLDGSYLIGLSLFDSKKCNESSSYSKCFSDDEISEIDKYVENVRKEWRN